MQRLRSRFFGKHDCCYFLKTTSVVFQIKVCVLTFRHCCVNRDKIGSEGPDQWTALSGTKIAAITEL